MAERIAIESYSEIIRYLGNDDPTTRRMLETIMAKEEEHADDMKKILDNLSEKIRPEKSSLRNEDGLMSESGQMTQYGHFGESKGDWKMEPSRYAHQNLEERLRVLIVDDDQSLRKVLYRITTGATMCLGQQRGKRPWPHSANRALRQTC